MGTAGDPADRARRGGGDDVVDAVVQVESCVAADDAGRGIRHHQCDLGVGVAQDEAVAVLADEGLDIGGADARAFGCQVDGDDAPLAVTALLRGDDADVVNRPGARSVTRLYGDGLRISSQSPGRASMVP